MGRSAPTDPFYNYLRTASPKAKSHDTALSYWYNVGIFKDWCRRREVCPEQATTDTIRAYLIDEQRRLGKNTLALRLSCLRAWFKYLKADPDPTDDVSWGREEIAPRAPFSETDFEKMKRACTMKRDRDMITVAYRCALRVAEVVGLRTWDIDLRRGFMVIRGKGSKQRNVAIDPKVRAVIQRYMGRTDGVLWMTTKGTPVSVERAKRQMAEIAKRAGVKAHWHRLRTSYACEALDAGMPVTVLKEILGHAHISTTERYGRWATQRKVHDQMRRFSARLKGF